MSSKLQDAIMIAIIMITVLNYAGHIKVDVNLMMVLLAIALYINQKSYQKSYQKSKVEPLDGSAVAFDKEAFVNLNNIVNELVKKDSVTIPGNLIVKGTTTFEDNMNVKGVTTIEKDLNVHTSVNVGTDDNNAIRLRQNRIGTKGCGEIEFHMTNGWLRHYNYGTSKYRSGCGFASGAMWSTGTMNVQGALTVDGATTLKGTLNIQGQTTCKNTTISGLTVTGATTCNGQFNCNGVSYFKMPNGKYSHINDPSGKCYIRGDIILDGHGGSGTSVFATGFKNKDNAKEGMIFDRWSLRLQANGDRMITLHPNAERNATRNTRYDFDGTGKSDVDAYGNIYQRLSDGYGRWVNWSRMQK